MEILDTPESFEIKVPVRKYWIPMFLYGMFALTLSIIVILFLMIGVTRLIKGINLEIPLEIYGHILLFPIFLNLAMWFVFGYEKMIIINNRLEVIKSNRIFSKKRIFNLCEIEAIEIPKKNPNIIWSSSNS